MVADFNHAGFHHCRQKGRFQSPICPCFLSSFHYCFSLDSTRLFLELLAPYLFYFPSSSKSFFSHYLSSSISIFSLKSRLSPFFTKPPDFDLLGKMCTNDTSWAASESVSAFIFIAVSLCVSIAICLPVYLVHRGTRLEAMQKRRATSQFCCTHPSIHQIIGGHVRNIYPERNGRRPNQMLKPPQLPPMSVHKHWLLPSNCSFKGGFVCPTDSRSSVLQSNCHW